MTRWSPFPYASGMSMTIILKPETELLVRQELQTGHFQSIDEMIVEGVHARRGKEPVSLTVDHGKKTPAQAVEHIRQARQGSRLPPGVTVRDLIDEGRA